ncbi:MAG: GntR family transcriptional regulator [Planctomycetaceae bacterium]|nr:GntR family transcriptional regulator [Planctomycetaceae bacterium]MCB9951553.1 GntR family transcriptional regulator [Planctomycetaceae bacterium]
MQISPTRFAVHPSSGVPIYRQLIEQVLALIVSGQVKPGDMLPSVREMGSALGVNMMTVSKAYARLEADGVVERARGRGMLIAEQTPQGSVASRLAEFQPVLEQAVIRGRQLGLSDRQIKEMLQELLKAN